MSIMLEFANRFHMRFLSLHYESKSPFSPAILTCLSRDWKKNLRIRILTKSTSCHGTISPPLILLVRIPPRPIYWVHYQISIHKVEEHTHKSRSDLALGDSFRALKNGQYYAWIRYSALNHLYFEFTNFEETYSPLSNSWVLCDAQRPARSSIKSLSV